MRQRITIEGRNVNDLFRLPCVRGIYRRNDGGLVCCVQANGAGENTLATIGDSLVEDDDGLWSVERAAPDRRGSPLSGMDALNEAQLKKSLKTKGWRTMRTLIFDVMLKGRFACTLRYKYCPVFPTDSKDLHDFIISKRPALRNQPFNAVFDL